VVGKLFCNLAQFLEIFFQGHGLVHVQKCPQLAVGFDNVNHGFAVAVGVVVALGTFQRNIVVNDFVLWKNAQDLLGEISKAPWIVGIPMDNEKIRI